MGILGFFVLLVFIWFIVTLILESLGYDPHKGGVAMARYFFAFGLTAAVYFILSIIGKKLSANKKDPEPNRAGWKDRRSRRPKKE